MGNNRKAVRAVLMAAAAISPLLIAQPALAQAASTAPAGQGGNGAAEAATVDAVVVTSYRRSLENSANAKKNATNFIDSIYAEDIGKFPDLNLTESLQRLPGVQIDRDVTGEGTYINVRGLSAGFTVTTINGFNVSTTSNMNEGRGSSLDLLPSEFFRRLTLSKSPTADTVEGGTAGVVDMQPVRAFDRKGPKLNIQAQTQYQDANGTFTPRVAVIGSNTFKTGIGEFGVLAAGAWANRDYRSEIFNTVGYTTMNIGSRCPTAGAPANGCNTLNVNSGGYGGGAGATLTTVPTNVPAELGLGPAGSPLVECGAGVPGGTSGLSCQDLSYAIVPRLGRAEQIVGSRNRAAGLFNVEYRPNSRIRVRADALYSKTKNEFGQYDVMTVVRSYNNNIPIDFKLDENKVLTSGTFGNSYFLNQSDDAHTGAKLFYRSFSGEWDITNNLRLSAQYMKNTGRFSVDTVRYTMQSAAPRIAPAVYPAGGTQTTNPASDITPLNTGQYVNYSYTPGDLTPQFSSNLDLANFKDWYWNSIDIIPTRMRLDQDSYRFDLAWGDARRLRLSAGYMRQNMFRRMVGWNSYSCAWRGACGSNWVLQEKSIQEVIPNGQIGNWLTTLPSMNLFKGSPINAGFNTGWLVPDFDKIRKAVNLDYFFYQVDPGDQPSSYLNSYTTRVLEEKVDAGYVMLDGRTDLLFDRELRFNAGLRYSKADQAVSGIVNDYILIGGQGARTLNRYTASDHKWLPSANVAYMVTSGVVLRGAAARTLTRADPTQLAPRFDLSLDADNYTIGNPALKPFYADNFDAGIEWYPKSRSVLTFNAWWKKIYDYPYNLPSQQLFSTLNIDFTRLSTRQQAGLINLGNGDYNKASVTVVQRRNSDLVINLAGQEVSWIQPTDFLLKGTGFNVNVTHIKQSLSGQVPVGFNPNSLLAGLAPWTYNGTVYYENKAFQIRFSYTHRDANIAVVCPCNNIPGDLYTTPTDYLDAQLSFVLPWYRSARVTLQAQNLLKQVQYNQYLNRESMVDGATYAGRNFVIGLRADF